MQEFLRLWFRENCDPYNDEVSYKLNALAGFFNNMFACEREECF